MAYYNQLWKFITPNEGLILWVNDEDKLYVYDGSAWASYIDNLSFSKLGINATADTTNKLAVASDAVLLSHNGTNLQVKVNKNAAANTASHLFQDNFSGRAEFGLIGNDDVTLKVSPNGSTWKDTLIADKTTGISNFPNGVKILGGTSLTVFDEGTFTPTVYGATTAGTPTYTAQAGFYQKIGNWVSVTGRINISARGGMTGAILLGGLPFVVFNNSSNRTAISIGRYAGFNLASGYLPLGYMLNGQQYIQLLKMNNTAGNTAIAESEITDSFEIYYSARYYTA